MEEELLGQISENDNIIANLSNNSDLHGDISTSGKIIASMIAERGPTGQQGQPGTPGEDGNGIESIELTSTVGKVKTYTITFTDGTTTTFNVTDGNDGQDGQNGADGQPGQDGEDGISPVVSVSKVGKVTTITITDADGVHTATINDGEDGQGAGDMLKSVYDTNDNGIVDNAEKVNNHTVNKDVPSDALFTDTIYDDTPVTNIESKIPSQATSTNQLADKDFVNSSINSVTAFYITKNSTGDQFNTKAELLAATTFYSGGEVRVPTRNDYCIVLEDESKQNPVTLKNPTTRYIYQNNQWEYQYTVNETAFTAAQLAAINSGITSSKITELDAKYNKPNTGIPKTDLSSAVQTSLDKADSAIQNVKTINNTDVKGTGDLKNTIVDLIYPVGAIYISANIVNPSTLFGGTWEQIKDRFLIGCGGDYSAGATGGRKEVTLSAVIGACNGTASSLGYIAEPTNEYQKRTGGSYIVNGTQMGFSFWNHSTPVVDYSSSNRETNILPPYLAVYMWKRTA